jgi:hypothetical protein
MATLRLEDEMATLRQEEVEMATLRLEDERGFCQATRLQYINSHIMLSNRCVLQQQVKKKLKKERKKKGALNSQSTLIYTSYLWLSLYRFIINYPAELVVIMGKHKLCEHGKRSGLCKICPGFKTQKQYVKLCEHKRQKAHCKECSGSAIGKYKCKHGRRKYQCKTCGGSSLCVHNSPMDKCKVCVGSSVCVHNRRKHMCKACGGSGLCVHNRQKHLCQTCGGSSICKHNKQRGNCKECKSGKKKNRVVSDDLENSGGFDNAVEEEEERYNKRWT